MPRDSMQGHEIGIACGLFLLAIVTFVGLICLWGAVSSGSPPGELIPELFFGALLVTIGVGFSVAAVRKSRRLTRSFEDRCTVCGFDIRYSKNRCPECGSTIRQ